MKENEIGSLVVGGVYQVHRKLGPGLLESVYEAGLSCELEGAGLRFCRQLAVPIVYGERKLDEGFRLDFLVEDRVIVELKSVEALLPVHFKQVLTYLRLTDLRLAYLINFNVDLIKHGIKRVVNGAEDWK